MVNWTLHPDNGLFKAIKEKQPAWWLNLMSDNKIWADIRKNNRMNIYYITASIMRLWFANNDFKAEMHFEYIPIQEEKTQIPFDFSTPKLDLDKSKFQIPALNDFEPEILKKIKKRIAKHNPAGSEKTIQAGFVLKNYGFIDTEFQHGPSRVDLVWADSDLKKIFFVELKTIGDDRLYFGEDYNTNKENVVIQLSKYNEFVSENKTALLEYYQKLFLIKKSLNILPEDCDIDNLEDFTIEEKPILLVGDCTQKWIEINSEGLNEKIKEFSYGAFYHGVGTQHFYIPSKNRNNKFIFV